MPLLSAAHKQKLQAYTRKAYYKQCRRDLQQIRDQKQRTALSYARDALRSLAWDRELQTKIYNSIEMISHWSRGHGALTEELRQLDVDNGVKPESDLDYDSLFTVLTQEPEFQHLFHPDE